MSTKGLLSDPQKFITMHLQQLGLPMPKQRVMELAVQLIESQAEILVTTLEWATFQMGVAGMIAMLVAAEVIEHD